MNGATCFRTRPACSPAFLRWLAPSGTANVRWDLPDLLSWPQVNSPLRVIRSLETHSVKRQLDGKHDPLVSDWIWVTTLPLHLVSTSRAVAFGHQRWDIENHGFNELANGWHTDHTDHIYTHDPNAIECFLLTAFLAFNIFHAFFALN